MKLEQGPHITEGAPRDALAAAEILRLHPDGTLAVSVPSALRNFLAVTEFLRGDEVAEEAPPAQGSRQPMDDGQRQFATAVDAGQRVPLTAVQPTSTKRSGTARLGKSWPVNPDSRQGRR